TKSKETLKRSIADAATRYLTKDRNLCDLLTEPPAAGLNNIANSTDKFYLMVCPDLNSQSVTIDNVAYIATSIIRILLANNALAEVEGLVILSRVTRDGRLHRISRLGLSKGTLYKITKITTDDILKKVPFDGCISYIYLDEIIPPGRFQI